MKEQIQRFIEENTPAMLEDLRRHGPARPGQDKIISKNIGVLLPKSCQVYRGGLMSTA